MKAEKKSNRIYYVLYLSRRLSLISLCSNTEIVNDVVHQWKMGVWVLWLAKYISLKEG